MIWSDRFTFVGTCRFCKEETLIDCDNLCQECHDELGVRPVEEWQWGIFWILLSIVLFAGGLFYGLVIAFHEIRGILGL